jgi:prepilin-type N-terminal cleavage/methylation domain-containing protein
MNIFKKTYKYGFTLVELLVVITVIAILASISFKAASVMNERTAVARTTERLAGISACLAEYYAEFGQYPGVNRVKYTEWDKEEGPKPPDWDAKVAEKRASGDTDFATDDDGGLVYYFRKVMDSQKWDEFKDEVGLSSGTFRDIVFISGDVIYSNKVYTLIDGWGGEFQYNCEEPYTSYELYSRGATGNANDDIRAGQKY